MVPTGVRVRVLGIDGLDRRMADQMIARGEMPHLQALLAGGAHAVLRAEPEQVPAIVWTTIATGRGPEAHGIRSTGARRLPGMRVPMPLTGDDPFARALGTATDLLRLGPRPARDVGAARGQDVLERRLREGAARRRRELVGDLAGRSRQRLRRHRARALQAREGRSLRAGDGAARGVRPAASAGARAAADKPRGIDAFALAAARALRGTAPPDVEAVYLPGLDIATMQHVGEGGAADLAGLDARLDAVRALLPVRRRAHRRRPRTGWLPSDVLVLVGDPGRMARRSGAAEGAPRAPRRAGRGRAIWATVSERDVAPTVLHLAGLPASRELEGRVLEAALSPAFRAAHPVRTVASYGRRAPGRPAESAFDRDMLEELRALGYVQ